MNAALPPRLQVLILAAGFSSRLGRPKALARIRSVSLLRRTLTLAACIAPAAVILVLPHRATRYKHEARGLNVTFASNPRRAEGVSSSVRRGIAQGRYSSAVLLLPVDLADLRHREVGRLVSRWRASRRCVVARRLGPQDGNSRGGTPLILPRWLYARALAVTGDRGLGELVNGLPADRRVWVDLPSAARDVDTREDLRAARRRPRPFRAGLGARR